MQWVRMLKPWFDRHFANIFSSLTSHSIGPSFFVISVGPTHAAGIVAAKLLVRNLFIASRSPTFQIGRWLKLIPSLVWWTRFLLLSQAFGPESMESMTLKQDVDDMEQFAVRLSRGVNWANFEMFAFEFMVVLSLT